MAKTLAFKKKTVRENRRVGERLKRTCENRGGTTKLSDIGRQQFSEAFYELSMKDLMELPLHRIDGQVKPLAKRKAINEAVKSLGLDWDKRMALVMEA